ncbi:MAG: PAS domain S-box protein [Betaproteobacteria bacterium]|nr:PAS domain S-box protein [Betaproteobacteria bacterium]
MDLRHLRSLVIGLLFLATGIAAMALLAAQPQAEVMGIPGARATALAALVLLVLLLPGGLFPWAMERSRRRREAAEAALRRSHDELERRVVERTEALRASEARLEEAQRIAHIGNWELDLADNHLHWSEEIFRLFEIDPARFGASYEAFLNAIHPDDRDRVNRAYTDSLRDRTPYAIAHRLLMPDGHVKWVQERCETHFAQDGRPLRSVGTVQDVTEAKQAEFQLHRFAHIVENAEDLLAFSDLEQRYVVVNPAYAAAFGVSAQTIKGRYVAEVMGPELYARLAPRLERALAGEEQRFTSERTFADGRTRVLDASYRPFRMDGRVEGLVIIHRDITERVRAEEALAQHRRGLEELVASRTAELEAARERAQLILESTADGLFGMDTEDRIVFVNRAGCQMLGYEPEQLIGRHAHALIHHSHADGTPYPQAECKARMALREGRMVRVDGEVYWRANGQPLPVEYATTPMRKRGEIVGTVVSFRDTSQRRMAEEATRRAMAETERLARVRSDFLANMSHEIRTPLNAVLGMAQVGIKDSEGRRARDTFARILDSGQLLLAVVNDILDFSKIEAGKMALECVPFDLGQVIDRAVDLNAARAYARGLDFRVVEAPDLPPLWCGDALRITQVLVNLLSNAIKFTERGSITLAARRQGTQLRLSVADTGIGLSSEQQARLFQPFEQADGSTTRRFGGSGLGLSISRRLVELMDGDIRVESKPGEGATFEIILPRRNCELPTGAADTAPARPLKIVLADLKEAEGRELAEALSERGMQASVADMAEGAGAGADLVLLGCNSSAPDLALAAAQRLLERGQRLALACAASRTCTPVEVLYERAVLLERPLRARHVIAACSGRGATAAAGRTRGLRLQGLRILAAEDNEVNRVVLEEILAQEGAQLACTDNGRLALERLRHAPAGRYDVVLTDIQMPEMDGYETARRIRELAPGLPVIGLTAHAMPEERARCLAAGMVDHVPKPIDIERLVAAILQHVRRPAAPAAPAPAGTGDADARDAAAAPAGPVVDWDALAARFKGKQAFLDKLAASALEGHGEMPPKLRDCAHRQDWDALAFAAHSLKGMGGQMGAQRLFATAREAEDLARQGAPGTPRAAEALACALEEVIEALHARLDASA